MDFKVTDLVKNVVLAGIGAAAVTTEKAKDVADQLVKKDEEQKAEQKENTQDE